MTNKLDCYQHFLLGNKKNAKIKKHLQVKMFIAQMEFALQESIHKRGDLF
jgi:hypothetical protein